MLLVHIVRTVHIFWSSVRSIPRQRKSWRHAVVVTNKLIILETETAREMLTFTKKKKRLHVLKLTMGWE